MAAETATADLGRRARRVLAGEHDGIEVARTEGSFVFDSAGRRYIDFVMGWCVGNLGWGRPEIRRAVAAADLPDYVHPEYLYEPWVSLAEKLTELAPGKLARCYRATGGTEAVEIALQVALAATGRKKFVAVEDAYHGNSLGTLSIGGADNRERYANLLANCRRLAPPLDDRAATRLETMLAKRDVAAFVFEPIACNLGVMVPTQGFVDRLRELCSRHGTVLVADEVACGFGRTGRLFACENFGLQPDVLCLGKAITGGYAPMGATLISETLAKEVGNDVEIWSTFGWHPRSVAAALAVLRLWEGEGAALLPRVAETSALFEQRLLAMALEPGQLHVQGLAIALEIDDEQRAASVARRAREEGLLVSAEGGSLRLWPALDIPRATAEEGLDILERCLELTSSGSLAS
ncbi:MAG TPA: aspartate aminotransferase family protein [Thermoanaerobaculia bacterium]|nr:aspartate aminotransferase family protein [Thermoanaerobaculia bacterium]